MIKGHAQNFKKDLDEVLYQLSQLDSLIEEEYQVNINVGCDPQDLTVTISDADIEDLFDNDLDNIIHDVTIKILAGAPKVYSFTKDYNEEEDF